MQIFLFDELKDSQRIHFTHKYSFFLIYVFTSLTYAIKMKIILTKCGNACEKKTEFNFGVESTIYMFPVDFHSLLFSQENEM